MSHCDLILAALDRAHWRERIVEDGSCWVWMGYRDRLGYGRVTYKGHTQLLHRLLYRTNGGILENGRNLHHICENPSCVNPDHLEQITQREHLERHGHSGLRKSWELRRGRTHCTHGHEMTPENTRIKESSDGVRRLCRTCARERRSSQVRQPVEASPGLPAAEHLFDLPPVGPRHYDI